MPPVRARKNSAAYVRCGLCAAALLVWAAGAPAQDASRGTLLLGVTSGEGAALTARFLVLDGQGEEAARGIAAGTARVALEPGAYRLIVSRGPTHTLVDARFEVQAGVESRQDVALDRVLNTRGLVSIDPHARQAPREACDAEDLDFAMGPEVFGEGVAWSPHAAGGRFAAAGLCPWSGVPAHPGALDGLWGIGITSARAGAAWWGTFGHRETLRGDWMHLLSRGMDLVLIGGSGEGVQAVPGLPRMYCPGATREEAIASVREGRASLSWGILVRAGGGADGSQRRVDARFGRAELRVRVEAPPWVAVDEVTIFAAGEPVMRSDLRPYQDTVRLDRVYTLVAPHDTYYVVAASGSRTMLPYRAAGDWRPLGIAGPVWVDADGDGRITSLDERALRLMALHRDQPAAFLDELAVAPLGLRVQAAALSDRFVVVDHLADDMAALVRRAALGNLRRHRYPWAPDVLARRSTKTGGDILELAELVAALAACGKSTGFERLCRGFSRSPLGSRGTAFDVLLRHGTGVWPSQWQVIGPFADPDRLGVKALFGPDRGAAPGDAFRDRDGRGVSWHALAVSDGEFTPPWGDGPDVYYALARVRADHGAQAAVLLGAEDGVALWIDGVLVSESPGRDAAAVLVPYYFTRGEHTVMLKLAQRRGAVSVQARILTAGGAIAFVPWP